MMQNMIFLVVSFLILPRGSVRDETTFFIMLSILVVLVIVAIVLRRNRLKNES